MKLKRFKDLGVETYQSLTIAIPEKYRTIEVRAIVILKNERHATSPASVFWIIESGAKKLNRDLLWVPVRDVDETSCFLAFEDAIAFVKTNWEQIGHV